MSEIKELSIEIRLRNNRLRQRRLELGLTLRGLAAAMGYSPSTASLICGLETMRRSPLGKKHRYDFDPGWRPLARALAKFFGVPVGELFPDVLRSIEKVRIEKRVDVDECRELLGDHTKHLSGGPHRLMGHLELAVDVEAVLSTLTPREEKVLRMRFGIGEKSDHTLGDVAQRFGTSRERVRQIEAKALRKLRHSSRSKHLKDHTPREPPEPLT